MKSIRNWLAVIAATLALCAVPAMAADAAGDGADRHGMENDMPIPGDAEALANGKDRYSARCSYCHTPLGRGGSSGVCLACQKYKWGSRSSQIYATIAAGRPQTKMGAFATSLSQEEIFNIIAYIRSLQELKIQDDLKAARAQ